MCDVCQNEAPVYPMPAVVKNWDPNQGVSSLSRDLQFQPGEIPSSPITESSVRACLSNAVNVVETGMTSIPASVLGLGFVSAFFTSLPVVGLVLLGVISLGDNFKPLGAVVGLTVILSILYIPIFSVVFVIKKWLLSNVGYRVEKVVEKYPENQELWMRIAESEFPKIATKVKKVMVRLQR